MDGEGLFSGAKIALAELPGTLSPALSSLGDPIKNVIVEFGAVAASIGLGGTVAACVVLEGGDGANVVDGALEPLRLS